MVIWDENGPCTDFYSFAHQLLIELEHLYWHIQCDLTETDCLQHKHNTYHYKTITHTKDQLVSAYHPSPFRLPLRYPHQMWTSYVNDLSRLHRRPPLRCGSRPHGGRRIYGNRWHDFWGIAVRNSCFWGIVPPGARSWSKSFGFKIAWKTALHAFLILRHV